MSTSDRNTAMGSRRTLALSTLLVTLPAIIFYALSTRTAVNLPIWDDYDAGLLYLNRIVTTPSLTGKLYLMLTVQHNEYKLLFVNVFFWLQYALFGRINFFVTSVVCNLLVIPAGLSLWIVFQPRRNDLLTKLLLFFPTACLWFQLNYAETVNWGIDAYQTMPVVALAFLSLYLLAVPGRARFTWATICMVLAIASSANGFLLAPIGAWILFRGRRFGALFAWLAVAVLCMVGYFYHYELIPHPSVAHKPILFKIAKLVLFFITFLGNAASKRVACPVLGAMVCLFWIWMGRRGYFRRRPVVACCMSFILLTAAVVTVGRVDYGFWGADASRYRLYGDFMLIFAWQAIAEEFIPEAGMAVLRNSVFRWAAAVGLLFTLVMDRYGYDYLRTRNLFHERGMYAFEHPTPAHPAPNPVPPMPDQAASWDAWDTHTRQVLIESIRLGTYQPPPL